MILRQLKLVAITAAITAGLVLAAPSSVKKVTASSPWRVTLSAVAKQQPSVQPQFSAPPRVVGMNLGRRIYLFHGLPGYASYWDAPSRQAVLDGFLSNGAQVVVLRLPNAEQRFFADGGAAYCKAFETWFRATEQAIDARYGPAQDYAAGISYGGYHAMLAASMPEVDGWIAISPVTDLARLAEFRFQSNANCRPSLADLKSKPGIMIYGQNDTRVGSDLMEASAKAIKAEKPANFREVELDAPSHNTTPEMSDAVMGWYSKAATPLTRADAS